MIKQTSMATTTGVSRRRFLAYAGALAGAGTLTLQACRVDDDVPDLDPGVDLGSGDAGVLNYAYALEQLKAAFYTEVINAQYAGITAAEVALLTDIRDHEAAHRAFLKAAITAAGTTPLQELEFDFSSIDFSSRDAVLATARTLEDLGVAAYNGAGKLLKSTEYFTIAGKIVSVEARHAAYIRDLISNGSFADLGSGSGLGAIGGDASKGLDAMLSPGQVLAAADQYIVTRLNAANLPTS